MINMYLVLMMSLCHSYADIDECSSANECHQNATCNNTKGSYNCTCKDGFEGDGKNCTGKILLKSITTNSLRKRNLRKGKSTSKFLHYFFSSALIMAFLPMQPSGTGRNSYFGGVTMFWASPFPTRRKDYEYACQVFKVESCEFKTV